MKPTAAPAHFPYISHGTMAEVMADEALDDFRRLPFEQRKGRTLQTFERRRV